MSDKAVIRNSLDPWLLWLVPLVRPVLIVVLVVYWLAMYTGTHIPRLHIPLGEIHSDKVLHFSAYCVLAVLLMGWRASRSEVRFLTVFVLWILIALYGVFDELTQPYFNRSADAVDWIADVLGAAVGLAVTWRITSYLRQRYVAVIASKT